MLVSLIAAVQKDGGLGYQNDLVWDLLEDLRRFRKLTFNKSVIMGRKTFESIGYPLYNRNNIVISRNLKIIDGCTVYDNTISPIYDLWNAGQEEIFIIGGAEIYKAYLPFVRKMYLTYVDAEEKCDTFFPTVDLTTWQEVENAYVPANEKNQFSSVFKTLVKV